jgi:hypothetical protein
MPRVASPWSAAAAPGTPGTEDAAVPALAHWPVAASRSGG